jgi:hypothetical protein
LNIADGQICREGMVRVQAAKELRLFDSAGRARYFGLLVLCGKNLQETTAP